MLTVPQTLMSREGLHLGPAQTRVKNKKQETKRFSTLAVYRLCHSETKQKKTLFDSRMMF